MKVYLDYFWIPTSYTKEKWGPEFFNVNLPNFVKNDLLDFKSLYKNVELVSGTGFEQYLSSDSAVIFLPFCCTTFVNIYICMEELCKWFTVSFECDTNKSILMAATHRIPNEKMKELGKELHQENIYCTVTRQMLKEVMENGPDKKGALQIFDLIPHVSDVRMIKLTALRKHHPHNENRRDWPCSLGVSRGGFVGLIGNE